MGKAQTASRLTYQFLIYKNNMFQVFGDFPPMTSSPFPSLEIPMIEIFGDFIDDLPAVQEYLIIGFSPSSIPLKQRWRNNGLSADFLADYLTTFFPGSDKAIESTSVDKQAEIRGAVSYIANELLENAMKFNDEKSPHPISIQLHLNVDRIIFLTTNSINPEKVAGFQAFIKEIVNSEPSELYLQQVEKNAKDETGSGSRLGYLTMIEDYMAKLGWKFQTVQTDPEVIAVTTMVQLMV